MIGRVLAKREFNRRIQELVNEHEGRFAEMPSDEASEYVQDLAIGLEVDLDLHWNPIAHAAADKSRELFERGLSSSHGTRYLDPPGMPDVPIFGAPNFMKAFEARVAALNRATWVGCQF